MKIFDIHAHIYPETIAPRAVQALKDGYDGIEVKGDGTLGTLVSIAESAGIDKLAVHAAATTLRQVDSVNRFIMDAAKAYPGIREMLEEQRARGGRICVISHSFTENILRDYRVNGLPEPDAVYGWEYPPEQRKPSPWPIRDIMEKFGCKPEEMLVVDDLKPGYDMARAVNVPFAAAGWANDIPEIETFMRKNCDRYFKTVAALGAFLFEG